MNPTKSALEKIVEAKKLLNLASFILQSPGDAQRKEALIRCEDAAKDLAKAINDLKKGGAS